LESADTAIKLDPKLGIAYYNRASARAALGEYSQARDDLHTIFTVDSNRRLRRAAEEAVESLKSYSYYENLQGHVVQLARPLCRALPLDAHPRPYLTLFWTFSSWP
jgi:tetratricopeptide (TPR) repeat protein